MEAADGTPLQTIPFLVGAFLEGASQISDPWVPWAPWAVTKYQKQMSVISIF